jgi:hypothetical protein
MEACPNIYLYSSSYPSYQSRTTKIVAFFYYSKIRNRACNRIPVAESRKSFNFSSSERLPENHEDKQLAAWATLSNSHLRIILASIARDVSVCN